jgi:hypothetical protein
MYLFFRSTIICFLLSTMALAGCAATSMKPAVQTSGDIPEWVNHPNKKYPDSQYIVGVGSGDTRNAAEKDAVGQISKVFQSVINVDETLIENYLETRDNSSSDFSFSSQMLNRTSVGSQQELKNIKIDQVHFSSADGLYYVLAYLDRSETAVLYKQDILQNEQNISEYFENYKSGTDKLNKYAYLNKCKTITAINDILKNQYQVITKGQENIPAIVPVSEIDKEMQQLLMQISVGLAPKENTRNEVTDYLKEVIGKIGFRVVNGQGDFTFNYGLDIKPTDLNRDNLIAFNWKLTLEVSDNVNHASLKTFNISKRTAAISEGEADAKILNTVQSQLNKQFYKQFLEYLGKL